MEIKIISPIHQPIKVEKNIPLPERKIHYSVLPFDKMDVGDSFLVERGRFRKKYFYDVKSFVYRMAKNYLMETGHVARFTMTVDRLNNGVRCWRIE